MTDRGECVQQGAPLAFAVGRCAAACVHGEEQSTRRVSAHRARVACLRRGTRLFATRTHAHTQHTPHGAGGLAGRAAND
eukprot:335829-Prymnesium_polylepis.1